MLKDRMVRVKMKKYFHEQKPISYVGKCSMFTETWIVVEGKSIMLARREPNGVQVDSHLTQVVIPRESIDSIRVLPDAFDINSIKITTEGQQLHMVVDGKRDCFIGEMGEG
jgi:hypothetical protein